LDASFFLLIGFESFHARSAAKFSVSDHTLKFRNERRSDQVPLQYLICDVQNILAQKIVSFYRSCVLFVPVDVVKERLQVQAAIPKGTPSSNPKSMPIAYKGSLDALQTILRTEGLGGIYRGYGATLFSYGPWSALYFCFYEMFRSALFVPDEDDSIEMKSSTFSRALLASAAAGGLSGLLTNPFDVVKLRLQLQRGTPSDNTHYQGFFDGFRQILKQEGIRGLLKGCTARVVFFAPSLAISMAVMEECKARLR